MPVTLADCGYYYFNFNLNFYICVYSEAQMLLKKMLLILFIYSFIIVPVRADEYGALNFDTLDGLDENKVNNTIPNASDTRTVPQEAVPWKMFCHMDGQLFPSMIITMSNIKWESSNKSDTHLGSPLAFVSVFIHGQSPGDKVTVEVYSTKIIQPSHMDVVLNDPSKEYEIRPHLKYEYEKLLSIRQPYPEDITTKVYLNGKLIGEKTQTIIIRSINDCPFAKTDKDGSLVYFPEMFAAYVNEGNPLIDDILAEALKKKYVNSFIGYQSGIKDVQNQVAAIWQVIQDRKFHYSNITTTSVESDKVLAQHVRLVGDSNRGSQANCADGSVLFASIFRKIGLNTFLVLLPGHMMVGVGMDNNNTKVIFIETTMVGHGSISDAILAGQSQKKKCKAQKIISIDDARKAGFLPLRDLNYSSASGKGK